jgi:CubicO group peptidase (beta-lactamase class C family)
MKKLSMVIFLSIGISLTLFSQTAIIDKPEVASNIKLFESWVKEQMDFNGYPGLSVGIVYDQQLIYAKGFGLCDRENKVPASPTTIYRIASITKTFTATALLILRDEGKLRLDDPVQKYLPWFKIKSKYADGGPITIEQLITHTSGLPRESAFPYWTDHNFPTREQMIEALSKQETIYAPSTKYKYSNLGLAIAGEVVAAAAGVPYEEFIQKRILTPLGMSSTSVQLSPEHKKRLAVGYAPRMLDGLRAFMPFTDAKGITPAANMSSTVEDFAKYISLHFREGKAGGNQILCGNTLKEMERVHWIQPSWKSAWGLGFGVRKSGDRVIVGHGGWVGGYRTQISFSPEEKIGIIVLSNADDCDPSVFINQIYSMLVPVIKRAVTPPVKPAVYDSAWVRYTGLFQDPWGWKTEFMIIENKLVMYDHSFPPSDDPKGGLVDLTPEGPRTFRKTGDNGDGELVVFELDAKGNIERVKVGENFVYPPNRKK